MVLATRTTPGEGRRAEYADGPIWIGFRTHGSLVAIRAADPDRRPKPGAPFATTPNGVSGAAAFLAKISRTVRAGWVDRLRGWALRGTVPLANSNLSDIEPLDALRDVIEIGSIILK